MSSIGFHDVVRLGKFYYPATSHYGTQSTTVVCDRCQRTNLVSCIGYGEMDLCLPCAHQVAEIHGPDAVPDLVPGPVPERRLPVPPPIPPRRTLTRMRRGDLINDFLDDGAISPSWLATRTKMMQDSLRRSRDESPEEHTLMRQGMFD